WESKACDIMGEARAAEGMTLRHIIGPKTGHKYHPDSKVEINKRIDAIVEKGRERMPKQVRFTTFTLRYNKSSWVEIDRLEKHWERTRVDATIFDAGKVIVKTSEVRALTLTMPSGDCPLAQDKPIQVTLDGQKLEAAAAQPDRSWSAHFLKIKDGKWVRLNSRYGHVSGKRPGLQGPIDDAFMERFIIVRPTGKSKWPAVDKWVHAEMERAIKQWRSQFRGEPIVKDDIDVTQEDVESSNLAVWGDVYSNKLLAAMGGPSERFYLAGLRYTNNENDGVVGKQPN